MAAKPSHSPAFSAAPAGYNITSNELWRKMQALYGMYKEIGAGKYHSILVIGPPGIGKTVGADQYLAIGGARVVRVLPRGPNMYDILHANRHPFITLLFDDTDHVWDSEDIMSTLKIAVDPRGKREINDPRKVGHGRFFVNCRYVFITNKPVHDPSLMAFDKTMRPHIAALKSRFQLQMPLSFKDDECYHFACWMATDGRHLLHDMQYQGRSLSRDASNEVLAWFSANYPRLYEVSPRTLVNIAEYRLKSPDIWPALAEQWCAIEAVRPGFPPPWQIPAKDEIVKPEPVKKSVVEALPKKAAPAKKPAVKKKAAPVAKTAAKKTGNVISLASKKKAK